MSENIIEITNLTKIYEEGEVLAVDDISFSLKEGEILALLGPNGAGKTTTISILATLLKATEGKCVVNNYNVDKDPDKVRKSIGIVFQEPSVDGDMKARENLELHAILYGMPKKERKKKISEVLKLVDLQDKAEIYVKNYSGGMKRRLEIARGLIHEPRILFLDEPTLGLDPQTRRKIWEKIKELNKSDLKMTILITTHYMDEADELADRICIMDQGKIIAMDTSENLKKQLSGDVIDIKFEIPDKGISIPEIIQKIKKIPNVKNVSIGGNSNPQDTSPPMQLPKGMLKIDPAMIQAQMREILSDPKKLITAWKKMPMAAGMFLNAPIAMKKKIASMFSDDLLEQVPDEIKKELISVKKGDLKEDQAFEPIISISCEHGGQQLPMIIQVFNDNKISIKTINMHQPTLEDVFLHYVGTHIREESSNMAKNIKKMIQMRNLRK
ncbi:MAG: ATP-binding cassette domain-containing protein [Promethearchaeota archaeon]